jgi:hypothetical protein
MNSKLYDILKSAALIWLPALGTLYFAIASIWGFPDAGNVIGTITALDTFLGVVLKISSVNYTPAADGKFIIDGAGRTILQLEMTPEELAAKGKITFQVTHDITTPTPSND